MASGLNSWKLWADRSSFKNPQIEPLFNTSVVMGHGGLRMDHPQFFGRKMVNYA